jgi:glutamate dehydrogenase
MHIGGSMINRMGPFFVFRTEEEMGANVAHVARAYAIAREIFGVRKLWREIEALDYSVTAKAQYDSIFQISRMVRRAVYWLLQNYAEELDIEPMVARFQPGVRAALHELPVFACGRAGQRLEANRRVFESAGLPTAVAKRIAALALMTQVLDIIVLAREFRLPVPEVAPLYFELGVELRLDLIREHIEALKVEGRWRSMARATLRESLAQEQRALLRRVLSAGGSTTPAQGLATWLGRHQTAITRVRRALEDMQMSGQMDFATLSVALSEIRRLA